MRKFLLGWVAWVFFFGFLLSAEVDVRRAEAASEKAVVRAVLFYSPQCGHCHYVITEVLPPLFEKYGDQLELMGVDVTTPLGNTLFRATLEQFQLESGGVPFLVVGDTYLIGSRDIPEQFPQLIETYLAQGGVDWPNLPGLAEALAEAHANQPAQEVTSTPASQGTELAMATEPPADEPQVLVPSTVGLDLPERTSYSIQERFMLDPAGNSLSVAVLVVMAASVVGVYQRYWRSLDGSWQNRWNWLIPLVCLAGMGVAAYLAYVETAQVEAVCGPIGDCNTVQQSEYAILFGVLPIGILGFWGYGAMLLAWALGRYTRYPLAEAAHLALFTMAGVGTLFSIYLTFLEPFVIGATCLWCLTSAVLMTALLWISAPGGRRALSLLSNK